MGAVVTAPFAADRLVVPGRKAGMTLHCCHFERRYARVEQSLDRTEDHEAGHSTVTVRVTIRVHYCK